MKTKHRARLACLAEDLYDIVTEVTDHASLYAATDDKADLALLVVAWNQAVNDLASLGEALEKHAVTEILGR